VGESFAFEPVEWITAGAVGEPGRRTFYLQATRAGDVAAILLEKEQVRRLAELAQELLARVDVTVTPDDLDVAAQSLREPVTPAWRAGMLSLGMDEDGEIFLLEAEEALPDPDADPAGATVGRARFVMARGQLVAMTAHAAYSVEAGARETCRLCSRPIDPVAGHVCPATNGHGPLTN
jgi:uncharacterized repeat protein (TIGR03847 family)